MIRIGLVTGGVLAAASSALLGITAATVGLIALSVGLVGLVHFAWTERERATERLGALPFPVIHDQPAALAADSSRTIEAVELTLREPVHGPPRDQLAQALAPGASLKIDGLTAVLTSGPRTAHELADVLSTWGLAVHERHGVIEVRVRWSRVAGPPASL